MIENKPNNTYHEHAIAVWQDPSNTTMPLYRLLQDRNSIEDPLRINQRTDTPTTAYFWELHQPELQSLQNILPHFPKLSEEQLAQLTPDASWYQPDPITHRDHAESPHGRIHSLRVALYARVLAEKEFLSESEIKILDAAALIHDLGRQNDVEDKHHGIRSARWIEKNWQVLEKRGIELNDHEKYLVKLLCVYHETPYNNISAYTLAKAGILLRIFRAADALDRYRIANEAWWPNTQCAGDRQISDFLEYLMPFAKYFTLATEYYRTHYQPDIIKSTKIIGEQVGLVTHLNTHRREDRRIFLALT